MGTIARQPRCCQRLVGHADTQNCQSTDPIHHLLTGPNSPASLHGPADLTDQYSNIGSFAWHARTLSVAQNRAIRADHPHAE